MNGRSRGTVSPNMTKPRSRGVTRRAVVGLILCIVLPPVGIFLLWKKGIFLTRGRVLVTILSCVICMFMIRAFIPSDEAAQLSPVMTVPQAVTPAPSEDWADSLSGVEDVILAEYQALLTPEPTVDPVEAARIAAEKQAKEDEVMNTIVYSVYNGAKYYHKAQTCGTQKCNKQQTVREALNNGLGACSLCNPVTP